MSVQLLKRGPRGRTAAAATRLIQRGRLLTRRIFPLRGCQRRRSPFLAAVFCFIHHRSCDFYPPLPPSLYFGTHGNIKEPFVVRAIAIFLIPSRQTPQQPSRRPNLTMKTAAVWINKSFGGRTKKKLKH